MTQLPIVMTAAGLQPQNPADLRQQLVDMVAATNPGYTANLPASLIEDIASTATFAVALCDQAKVELVNSLTPYAANPFILGQLGALYGVPQGVESNTSCFVVFGGSVGFVIQPGFLVGDGSRQYAVQDGGIISGAAGATNGTSLPIYVVSTTDGTFAVPPNTITQLATSIPANITLTVNNVQPGTPGGLTETIQDYHARVLETIRAPAQGMPSFVRTRLMAIPGVQDRLVSLRVAGNGYQVICGGGDPYAVARAIYAAVGDIALLTGSAIDASRNVTVTITDYPDAYPITYVNPPAQTVNIVVTWNTTAPNFVADTAVQALATTAIQDYVNGVTAGQPMILFQMEQAFIQSLSGVIDPKYITRLQFAVSINGTSAPPLTGTGEFVGDAESYFTATLASVQVNRG